MTGNGPSNVTTTGPWSLVPTSRSTVAAVARAASDVDGQHVVDAPADVALLQVAPRRPPGEELVVVRIERPAHVHQVARDEVLERVALVATRADLIGLALLRVHVALVAGDVEVPADQQPPPVAGDVRGPGVEAAEEAHLGLVVLAAVGHVDRRDGDDGAADHDVGRRDALFEIEERMFERRRNDRQLLRDQQRHARVALLPVPHRPVAVHVAQFERQLVDRRLDLLQADDVRGVRRQPRQQVRLPCAHAVHVPGRDLHRLDPCQRSRWP